MNFLKLSIFSQNILSLEKRVRDKKISLEIWFLKWNESEFGSLPVYKCVKYTNGLKWLKNSQERGGESRKNDVALPGVPSRVVFARAVLTNYLTPTFSL